MKTHSLHLIRLTACFVLTLATISTTLKASGSLSDADWVGIRAAHEANRYGVRPASGETGVWRTDNPGQQWAVEFDPRGFMTTAREGAWKWGLELRRYGRGDTHTVVHETSNGNAQGQRFSRRRDGCVEEWWVNDSRGLEHGFILHNRPAGDESSELDLVLDTRGGLLPKVLPDARGVAYQNEGGSSVVSYTGLKVWDADGKTLPAHFEPEGASSVRLIVQDMGARYPVTIDPVAQQVFLKAQSTGIGRRFGASIAMHGDTVVVGEPGGGPLSGSTGFTTGAIHVYVRTAGVWSHQATLNVAGLAAISNVGFAHEFGFSVAIHGDTIVAGVPGEDSSSAGVNSVPDVQFPYPGKDSGAAYVFVRSGTTWSQQAYLKASNTNENDKFGLAVSVSGDTLVVGAPFEDSGSSGINGFQNPHIDSFSSGAVYVFVRNGSTWSQQAYVKSGNNGDNGNWEDDNFGNSVSISGDSFIVGAPREDSGTTGINTTPSDPGASHDAGAAYVFVRSGTVWSQQAYIKASNSGNGDLFGHAVAMDGATAVVGAYKEDSSVAGVNSVHSDPSASFDAGAAYVFIRSGGIWSQQAYLKASNPGGFDWFGESVAINANTVVVGARLEDSNTTGVDSTPFDPSQSAESGAAYVYTRSSSAWTQQSYLKASNTGNGDWFGSAVAVGGDTVIIGAPDEDSNTTGFNPVSNNSANGAGAAYFFNGTGPALSPEQALLAAAIAAAGLTGQNAEFNAAPFSDGVSNLLKYAFNMNLSGSDTHLQVPGGPPGGLPVITRVPVSPNQAILRFEFVRRIGSGLIYTPLKTTDLSNPAAWIPLTDTPAISPPIDVIWERVIYEEVVDPVLHPSCFGRVQVTLP